MNSIQNPSIRILLLIKTLTLNQLKKKKKTSGLSGLVGLALRPLRETMQACDGAMKSLRSPIRSVAENFSDISFTFFPRFANSIRDFQSSSSSVLVCLSFQGSGNYGISFREKRSGKWKLKRGKATRMVGSEAVNLRQTREKGKVIIVCGTITSEEAEIFLAEPMRCDILVEKTKSKKFVCLVVWSAVQSILFVTPRGTCWPRSSATHATLVMGVGNG